LVTVATTLSLGGRIAGGAAFMPLVILACVILDFAAHLSEKHNFKFWHRFLFLALIGTVGNLICSTKRVLDPTGAFLSAANIQDLATAVSSHAVFGFLTGAIGTAGGAALLKLGKPPSDPAKS
jgi:hypothetical protein